MADITEIHAINSLQEQILNIGTIVDTLLRELRLAQSDILSLKARVNYLNQDTTISS